MGGEFKRSFFNGKYAALIAWGVYPKRQYSFAILAYVLAGGGGCLGQPYATFNRDNCGATLTADKWVGLWRKPR